MISHTSGELQRHFYCYIFGAAPHQKLFSGTVGGRDTTRSTVNIGYRVLSTLQQFVQNAVSNLKNCRLADLADCVDLILLILGPVDNPPNAAPLTCDLVLSENHNFPVKLKTQLSFWFITFIGFGLKT